MTEFETLLREVAKADRDIGAHFQKYPATAENALELLSAEVRGELNDLIRRKHAALDTIAALAVVKYRNEQL